jgi:hypothetical protein
VGEKLQKQVRHMGYAKLHVGSMISLRNSSKLQVSRLRDRSTSTKVLVKRIQERTYMPYSMRREVMQKRLLCL